MPLLDSDLYCNTFLYNKITITDSFRLFKEFSWVVTRCRLVLYLLILTAFTPANLRRILTWEDAYYDGNLYPYKKILIETAHSLNYGPYSHDLLGLAVAKMSYQVYSIGEGYGLFFSICTKFPHPSFTGLVFVFLCLFVCFF